MIPRYPDHPRIEGDEPNDFEKETAVELIEILMTGPSPELAVELVAKALCAHRLRTEEVTRGHTEGRETPS